MVFQNEFHRQSEQRKEKQIAEWKKSPSSYEDALKRQQENARIAKEMESQSKTELLKMPKTASKRQTTTGATNRSLLNCLTL